MSIDDRFLVINREWNGNLPMFPYTFPAFFSKATLVNLLSEFCGQKLRHFRAFEPQYISFQVLILCQVSLYVPILFFIVSRWALLIGSKDIPPGSKKLVPFYKPIPLKPYKCIHVRLFANEILPILSGMQMDAPP